jgi:hypothetical protein
VNIGDYVYIYLFDLEKSIKNMKRLRDDRFGKIINRYIIKNNYGNDVIVYDIQLLNGKSMVYRTDNLTTNMIHIGDLVELIGRANISEDKRQFLLDQIQEVLTP